VSSVKNDTLTSGRTSRSMTFVCFYPRGEPMIRHPERSLIRPLGVAVAALALLLIGTAAEALVVPAHADHPAAYGTTQKPPRKPRPPITPPPQPAVTPSASTTATTSPSATATPSTAPTPTTGPTVPSSPGPSSCASEAASVEFGGSSYCPGYVFAVRRTLYAVDTRIVLRGVAVVSVSGSRVQVAGGPSCLPTEWCGQTIPSITVTFPAGAALPAYGDVVSLYGITTIGGLTPVGFQVTGHCDPYWGDC